MLVHARIDSSQVNGPGNRAVLWFQGCSLNCPDVGMRALTHLILLIT